MLVLDMGIDHTADETTAAGLRTHIIQPAMEVLKKKLEDMISVILTPRQRTSYHVLWWNRVVIRLKIVFLRRLLRATTYTEGSLRGMNAQ
jgi:hypothetical protein